VIPIKKRFYIGDKIRPENLPLKIALHKYNVVFSNFNFIITFVEQAVFENVGTGVI